MRVIKFLVSFAKYLYNLDLCAKAFVNPFFLFLGYLYRLFLVNKDFSFQNNYHGLTAEQIGCDPVIPDTIHQLKELKKVLCGNTPKVENSSQYVPQKMTAAAGFVETADGSQWQNIDTIDDIEKFIAHEGRGMKDIYYNKFS